MNKVSLKSAVPFALSVVLYIAVVLGVAYVSVHRVRRIVEDSVDRRLSSAASTLRFLLPDDFHDRARRPDSIGAEEELDNRERFNAFASSAGFSWVYTLVELEGRLYFSAPTVSPGEAAERDRWYFYPYEDPPA